MSSQFPFLTPTALHQARIAIGFESAARICLLEDDALQAAMCSMQASAAWMRAAGGDVIVAGRVG